MWKYVYISWLVRRRHIIHSHWEKGGSTLDQFTDTTTDSEHSQEDAALQSCMLPLCWDLHAIFSQSSEKIKAISQKTAHPAPTWS